CAIARGARTCGTSSPPRARPTSTCRWRGCSRKRWSTWSSRRRRPAPAHRRSRPKRPNRPRRPVRPTPPSPRPPSRKASEPMSPTVDAHHHFWQHHRMPPVWHEPHRAAIARDYEPADLVGPAGEAGIDATVLIQAAETTEENDRLLTYAAEVPLVGGVVAWLPLSEPAAAKAELDRIGGDPSVRGVRCLIDRDDAD